jgi:hypothetical protein
MDEGRDVRRLIEGAMTTIKATIKDRRLELDVPADWPDGIEVEIHPLGQNGDDEAMSPEEIARTLAAMQQVEPFDMTEAERAAWEKEREERKQREKAQFAEHAEHIRRAWE